MSWLSVVSGFTLPASAPSTEVLLWVFPTSVELALQGHLGSFEDLLQGCEDSQGLESWESGDLLGWLKTSRILAGKLLLVRV